MSIYKVLTISADKPFVPSKSKRRTREFIFMGVNSLLGVALHMTEGAPH
ncbi:hypothetical protein PsalMR5_04673 (plasmid) [Piscirickettsia salmonis]|nr:hypothetical protein PsalSR1_04704 [Piscirickettsia salmonis]QGP62074.1 hypothetical protein PsalBI1_04716 [Piscirickettsia salmonis]QGP66748.1 hypothetical protein PsalMR5_04673 [Piscirickettsia salmonis]